MSQHAVKLSNDGDCPNGPDDQSPALRINSVDRYIGARIRERRIMMGVAQQQLARKIGVTYQQAHKYEHGLNRVSAGRLFDIAQALAVTPSWFFEGLAEEGDVQEPSSRQRMCLELARNLP